MKRYSSRELIILIEADDWYLVAVKDSHHQFMHPTKHGKVTIPHPRKDIPIKTTQSILKQTGLQRRLSEDETI